MTTPTTQREADERVQNAVHIFTCKGKGGEYELIGYSSGAGPKRGESIVVYRDTSKPNILYHRSADDFRERMEWLGARAATDQPSAGQVDERNARFPHCLNRTAFISDLTYQMYLAEIEGYTRPDRASLTPTAPQAASQQAGEDVEDWRVGEFWSSANPGKKVLMLALGIDIENFGRHKDFIRWVAAPQAATTASTCACGHAVKDCDPRDKFKCEQLQATTASAAAEKCPKCGWRADSADCCGEEECGAAPVQAAQPALPADVSQVLRDVRFALVDVESEYRPEGTIAATINNAIASIDKVLPDDDASPGAAQTADARDEALEDAAKLCESEICACCWKDGAEDAALYLAEEIRALKSDRATHPTDKGQTNE